MPAQLTAATGINPLKAAIQFVSAVVGPDLEGDSFEAPTRQVACEWIAALCVTAAMAMLLVVAGHAAGRRAYEVAPLLFWSGVVLLVVPISLRIGWPGVARGERLFLLFLLTEALFYYKSVYSPTHFNGYDEFLHWAVTDDLLAARRLFVPNPLFPIGPTYPALEILATAIVNLTGLPLFLAATLLLAILRGTLIVALFLLYENITASSRTAALACLVNMGCTTFAVFESMFSYESLGIMLCVLIFAAEAVSRDFIGRERLKALALVALLLASLAVTHHLSAIYAAIYLGAVAVLELLRRAPSVRAGTRLAMSIMGVLAIALPLLWVQISGNLLTAYLGPVVEGGFKALLGSIMGTPTPSSEHLGTPAVPIGLRLATLLGLLLVSLALAAGFFRSLALSGSSRARASWRPVRDILAGHWKDSRIVFLTLLALGFPISVAFRLTNRGWEIGNRMGTFVFIGVGLVVAVSIVHFWQGRAQYRWRRIAPVAALSLIVLAGVANSALNPIHGRYRVAADRESVEAMGIETARWTRQWLDPGNRFAADRVNLVLLATYGRQDVRTKVAQGVYSSRVFEKETLGPDEFWALAKSDLKFLLVDLRLTMAPPVLGFYFEPWDARQGVPLSGTELLKFDDVKGITRIYDNGWIIIYDVRGLHGSPE
ncbi:hypothetical protein ACFQZO_10890 [Bradyrhizobium sp. GCM10027634]|uniref:hypothetical protein n=1 Tax=unclassified Bradyrhizobium TaxID=2631580 RepID=UPI00263A9B70|nr:hypothetical protein [Bradyrhizobium sp. WYCCWR 12677]MDN5001389.1 hypothetical protein [Bradyrhizobium sp. WYCCWR 12677]